MSSDIGGDDQYLKALDAGTGELIWTYATGDFVFSSPAVADGVLYVGSLDENVYAFRLPSEQGLDKLKPPERPDPNWLVPDWSLQPVAAVTSAINNN